MLNSTEVKKHHSKGKFVHVCVPVSVILCLFINQVCSIIQKLDTYSACVKWKGKVTSEEHDEEIGHCMRCNNMLQCNTCEKQAPVATLVLHTRHDTTCIWRSPCRYCRSTRTSYSQIIAKSPSVWNALRSGYNTVYPTLLKPNITTPENLRHIPHLAVFNSNSYHISMLIFLFNHKSIIPSFYIMMFYLTRYQISYLTMHSFINNPLIHMVSYLTIWSFNFITI